MFSFLLLAMMVFTRLLNSDLRTVKLSIVSKESDKRANSMISELLSTANAKAVHAS